MAQNTTRRGEKTKDELEVELKQAVERVRVLEEENTSLKERVDPSSGSDPQCQASTLHKAESCNSTYTQEYKTKRGKLYLCKSHAEVLLGK